MRGETVPEIDRAKPGWEQIKDYLEDQISQGWLGPGELVPSARKLAREWGVSPGTANRALDALVTARLVTRSNAGTFVARGRLVPGPLARYRMTRFPPAEVVRVISAGVLERAPAYVRPVLGIEPVREDLWPVILRRELRSEPGGRPVSLTSEWVLHEYAEACPELAEPEPLPLPGGALALIGYRTGDHPARCRFSVESRLPQEDIVTGADLELPLLGLSVASPVTGAVWVWYDEAGKVLCFTETTITGGHVIGTEFTV
jgi:DNA-binding GntR family transcriptional regulator